MNNEDEPLITDDPINWEWVTTTNVEEEIAKPILTQSYYPAKLKTTKMNTPTSDNKNFGSMSLVTVKKEALLKILRENKEKHDTILKEAEEGFWSALEVKMTEKAAQFNAAIQNLSKTFEFCLNLTLEKIAAKEQVGGLLGFNTKFSFDPSFNLPIPVSHEADYSRAIRLVELDVNEEFQLTAEEFDSYICNNWIWKKEFSGSNLRYLNKLETKELHRNF